MAVVEASNIRRGFAVAAVVALAPFGTRVLAVTRAGAWRRDALPIHTLAAFGARVLLVAGAAANLLASLAGIKRAAKSIARRLRGVSHAISRNRSPDDITLARSYRNIAGDDAETFA
jgi:hypothetical protein